MSESRYYVSHQGQQMGPYLADEIVSFVEQGTLSAFDYIYDDSNQDWVLFLEHPVISVKVKNAKPDAAPKPSAKKSGAPTGTKKSGKKPPKGLKGKLAEQLDKEWFILKGDNKFGPFAYTDVIKMLQQGVVFEFDFGWHEGLEGWKRIAELDAFTKENVKALKDSDLPEVSQVFFRRRHKRVQYNGTILIHDNKKVWKGNAVEISEGGAGVVMDNSMVVPGQQLFLHFKPGDGVPPFNAVCEVVSKQYVFGVKDGNAPVKYGLRFKNLSTDTAEVLKEYSKNAKVA